MVQLDVATMLVVGVMSALVAAAMLSVSRGAGEAAGLREATRATWLLAGGAALQVLRGVAPDFVSIVVSNVLFINAVGQIHQAYRRFNAGTASRRSYGFVAAASVAFFCLWLAGAGYAARATFVSMVAVVPLTAAGYELVRDGGLASESSRRLSVGLAAVTIGALLVRVGVLASQSDRDVTPLLAPSLERTLAFVPGALLTQGFALAFLVLLRERSESDARALATTDALTGCMNRRALELRAHAELEYARRKKTPVAVLMLDLDHFKRVNDRHGHAVGDEVLRHVARVLRAGGRPSDVVARYGGEEFCVLLRDADLPLGAAVANRLCDALRSAVSRPLGVDVAITASMGVAACDPSVPESWESLFARADAALYRAKAAGRDRVEAA